MTDDSGTQRVWINMRRDAGPVGFAYLVSVVGAAVYFVGTTSGFWGVVLALLKSIVWPAFVVHRALELLNI